MAEEYSKKPLLRFYLPAREPVRYRDAIISRKVVTHSISQTEMICLQSEYFRLQMVFSLSFAFFGFAWGIRVPHVGLPTTIVAIASAVVATLLLLAAWSIRRQISRLVNRLTESPEIQIVEASEWYKNRNESNGNSN